MGIATSSSAQASTTVGMLDEMCEVYDKLGHSMNVTILKSGAFLVVSVMVPRLMWRACHMIRLARCEMAGASPGDTLVWGR